MADSIPYYSKRKLFEGGVDEQMLDTLRAILVENGEEGDETQLALVALQVSNVAKLDEVKLAIDTLKAANDAKSDAIKTSVDAVITGALANSNQEIAKLTENGSKLDDIKSSVDANKIATDSVRTSLEGKLDTLDLDLKAFKDANKVNLDAIQVELVKLTADLLPKELTSTTAQYTGVKTIIKGSISVQVTNIDTNPMTIDGIPLEAGSTSDIIAPSGTTLPAYTCNGINYWVRVLNTL